MNRMTPDPQATSLSEILKTAFHKSTSRVGKLNIEIYSYK